MNLHPDKLWYWIVGSVGALIALGSALSHTARLNRKLKALTENMKAQLAERDRLDAALGASEAFYHSLVEHLPINIIRKDVQGRFTFGNPQFCAEMKLTPAELIGKTDLDLFPRHLAEKYRADDLAVMAAGKTFEADEEHVAGDGSTRYVQVVKIPVRDAGGKIVGTQGIFRDVTDRRRAEIELRTSRERFDLAVRGSNDGIWDWDVRTNEVYFSPRWKSMLGYPDDQIANRFEEWQSRLHPDDRARAMATVDEYLHHRLPVYELEHRLRHKDGAYRWIVARGVALWDENGVAYRMAGSQTDITPRKEAEAALVQHEKLAALGQMVAGVAHEINNPLSFVGNNVAVLQRDVGSLRGLLAAYMRSDSVIARADPDAAREIAELAARFDAAYTLPNIDDLFARSRDGLKRIHQIVKDLRDFARLDATDMHALDLNAGVASTVNIARGLAHRKRVTVETCLGQLPPVTCYPAKINQVILNLLSNAIDASPEGGQVIITTRRAFEGDSDGVEVEVKDNGGGIDPTVRDKIFDPFFTTKPPGEGTGLGLSISYGIVQDHRGTIRVESEKGRGSTFTVRLPAAG